MSSRSTACIEDLFNEARLLSVADRDAFLDRACADNPSWRADLARLLNAFDRAGDFLEGLDLGQAAALIEPAGESGPVEQRIGPYQLVRELGRGGMGAVYLASRVDGQFDQDVALKLIARGMDSGAVPARFLQERQILARLRHANIASLLDGGVSDEGQPYFAMEYVNGIPITNYCEGEGLGVEARLRLFDQVCQAVHYAHTNLVVHRDLKPGNMLVTGDGQLKLLDFGIAGLLDDGTGAPEDETDFRVMTPEYAAPEQIRGEPPTTATDVYALGVVLYQLLTGQLPIQFERRTVEAVARVSAAAEPPPPSSIVSRLAAQTSAVADETRRTRATHPRRLERWLRGDLDAVILKSLRRDPADRYASVEAFVKDIHCHLAGLPVAARPDSVGYRARKFARRHWVGIAATALASISLVSGATLSVWQAQLARHEAEKAGQVADFMLSLFELSDPDRTKGGTITARELLDSGASRATLALPGQSEVQADLLAVVGEGYRKLGLYDAAEPLLRHALTLHRALLGHEHESVAASARALGAVLRDQGRYEVSEPLLIEALALQRRLLGSGHPEVATTLNTLAQLYIRTGDYESAGGLLRETIELRRELLGEHPELAVSLNDLGLVLYNQGEYDAAEPLYLEALALQRELLSDSHTDLSMTLNNLALLLQKNGDYAAAEPLLRQSLAMKRELLGDEHPSVATALANLGVVVRRSRGYAAAEPIYRDALAMWRRVLGEEHPDVATSITNLAVLLRQKGEYDASEALFLEGLAMKRSLLGAEHPSVAVSLSGLAGLLYLRGDFTGAESRYAEALAIRREALGAAHPLVATVLIGMARSVLAQGRLERAEMLLRDALAMREASLPEGDWRRGELQALLGACLSEQGRYAEAEPLLLAGYRTLESSRGKPLELLRTRQLLAKHYERQGLHSQATQYRLTEPE